MVIILLMSLVGFSWAADELIFGSTAKREMNQFLNKLESHLNNEISDADLGKSALKTAFNLIFQFLVSTTIVVFVAVWGLNSGVDSLKFISIIYVSIFLTSLIKSAISDRRRRKNKYNFKSIDGIEEYRTDSITCGKTLSVINEIIDLLYYGYIIYFLLFI